MPKILQIDQYSNMGSNSPFNLGDLDAYSLSGYDYMLLDSYYAGDAYGGQSPPDRVSVYYTLSGNSEANLYLSRDNGAKDFVQAIADYYLNIQGKSTIQFRCVQSSGSTSLVNYADCKQPPGMPPTKYTPSSMNHYSLNYCKMYRIPTVSSISNVNSPTGSVLNINYNTTDSLGTHTIMYTVNGGAVQTFNQNILPQSLPIDKSILNRNGQNNTVVVWCKSIDRDMQSLTKFTYTFKYDDTAPTVSFPSATYNTPHYEGETVTMFVGTDISDTNLDYEYKVYANDLLYTHEIDVKNTSLKLPYFEQFEQEYSLRVEVRAKQSADTINGTGVDIWSNWYTSPTITIKSPVLYPTNFNSLKWYQDTTQSNVVISPFEGNEYECQHYCNENLYSTTTTTTLNIIPPLLYTPIKPNLWQYTYFVVIRVKNNEGVWSNWYKSPIVEVQFNMPPSDVEFNTKIKPSVLQGEIITIEWNESSDPNGSLTTYTVSLMDGNREVFENTHVTTNKYTFKVPTDFISNNVVLNVVAYSVGLYSNPVPSPKFAITDVNVTDCTLNFPVLTTNITGQFSEVRLVINGDTKIVKTENLTNYSIPIHYFRHGNNTLKLVAVDRNNVEVTRTWNVNLEFDKTTLVSQETPTIKNFLSFNYDPHERFVEGTELRKNVLDLGVVEHELYGSTPFEGANTVTQKLVVSRETNDDTTQLRTLKITGAIE